MEAIILFVLLCAVAVRGFIINERRRKLVKKYMKNIVEPMEYVVKLQDEGLLGLWYKLDGCKNNSYIDATFKSMLSERKLFIEDYDDSNLWKCFIYMNLDELEATYESLHEAYYNLFNSILMREKLTADNMLKKGCHTWDEYYEKARKE